MEPELWVRCPKAAPSVASPYHPVEWSCPCHGSLGERPLVRVPDGAVERMERLIFEWRDTSTWPWIEGDDVDPGDYDDVEAAEQLLRAAIGEGQWV